MLGHSIIKDFILKIDDLDPGLNFLSVYRLQPLLQVKSKERQRRKFWQMIKGQFVFGYLAIMIII